MTAEQLFRDFASRLGTFRFRNVDHMIDFVNDMRREAVRAANDLSARRDETPAITSFADKLLGRDRRPTYGTLEINGRAVIIQKRFR